jgi:hypothetical protein
MEATNMTKAAWFHGFAVLCCILTLACTGCSSLTTAKSKSGKKDSSWSFFKKKPYQTPQSINVTWTYDIYTKEGKPPTRGFGGRLYFYNEKSQAIPVEGELTVYGFDDTERSHDGASIESADKRFRFTPEQFTTHFSESELGASYSIWIPWDAAPGMQKKIMLIPTFKTKDGPVIRGNAATVLLPGMTPQQDREQVIQASAPGGVQRASHNGSTNHASVSHGSGNTAHRTTTIQLPPRGYSAKPVLSPEQAAALLQQIQATQVPQDPVLVPAAMNQTNSESFFSNTTMLASEVATPMPSFHIPLGSPSQPGTINKPSLLSDSRSPGFAQASAGQRPVHSAPNSPQAPTGSAVPSSAYPPR